MESLRSAIVTGSAFQTNLEVLGGNTHVDGNKKLPGGRAVWLTICKCAQDVLRCFGNSLSCRLVVAFGRLGLFP